MENRNEKIPQMIWTQKTEQDIEYKPVTHHSNHEITPVPVVVVTHDLTGLTMITNDEDDT